MVTMKRIPMEERINEKALRASKMANSQYKLPILLLLDTSGSMEIDNNIGHLNEGVAQFYKHFIEDEYAALYTEITVITFGDGDARVEAAFGDPRNHIIKEFTPAGNSPFCTGLVMGLDLIEDQIDIYNNKGIVTHPPVIITLTDGYPTRIEYDELGKVILLERQDGEYKLAKEKFDLFVKELNLDSHIIFFGDKDENIDILKEFASSDENIRKLDQLDFVSFFNSLGKSISELSKIIPTGHSQFAMQDIFDRYKKK